MHPVQTPGTHCPLEPLAAYARECLRDVPRSTKSNRNFIFRDRFVHCMRVKGWCERLLTKIPGDARLVLPAAVLHDIGYAVSAEHHARHGAEMAYEYLEKNGFVDEYALAVSQLIRHHSDKSMDPAHMSLELIVLQDADCLDELGALTVFWDAMAEGQQEEQSYTKTYERLVDSYERLCRRNRKMKSEYGQFLYRQRLDTLGRFLKQIKYELFL